MRMDVQRLPILGVFSTLLKMLLMYSVIWKFRRPFRITFAACFCRPARKNLPAHPMPRRVILMYVADNASLVLSGLDKVKALGNLKPLKIAISEIRLALVAMPLFAHFSHSKHAKQCNAARLGKAGYLFCVFGMAVGTLCVVSVLVFLFSLSILL